MTPHVGSGTLCRKLGTPARQKTAKSGRPTFQEFQTVPLPTRLKSTAERLSNYNFAGTTYLLAAKAESLIEGVVVEWRW